MVDVADAMRNGVGFSMIFMMATAFCLSSLISSAETGISNFISNVLGMVFTEMAPLVTIILLMLLTLLITNLINNMVTVTIMAPIAIAMATQNGANLALLAVMISLVSLQGCVAPFGSIGAAITHSNEELIGKNIYIITILMMILLGAVLSVCAALLQGLF